MNITLALIGVRWPICKLMIQQPLLKGHVHAAKLSIMVYLLCMIESFYKSGLDSKIWILRALEHR